MLAKAHTSIEIPSHEYFHIHVDKRSDAFFNHLDIQFRDTLTLPTFYCFVIINKHFSDLQQVEMMAYSSVSFWIILDYSIYMQTVKQACRPPRKQLHKTYSETKIYWNNLFMLTLSVWHPPDTSPFQHQYFQTTF